MQKISLIKTEFDEDLQTSIWRIKYGYSTNVHENEVNVKRAVVNALKEARQMLFTEKESINTEKQKILSKI